MSENTSKNLSVSKPQLDKALASLPECAEYMGVSEASVRRWIRDGKLPALRIGGKLIRVRVSDLEALCVPVPHVGGVR